MSSKRVREPHDVQLPVISLTLDKIKVDEAKNLRRFEPNARSVEELATDILANGMINPVLVRKLLEGEYELVAGYQRMKALAHLNTTGNKIDKVQASVVEVAEDSPHRTKILNLMENLRRNELSYIDAAYAIKDLQDAGMTNTDIAKEFKKSGAWVSYISKMLTLRPDIQKKIHEGKINFRLARTLPDLSVEEQDEAISADNPEKAASKSKKAKPRKNKRGRKSREDASEGRNLSSKQAILHFEDMAKELAEAEGRKSKAEENAIEVYSTLVKFLTGALGIKAFHNRLTKVL
jgi:ParB family chromosome partitioning protein